MTVACAVLLSFPDFARSQIPAISSAGIVSAASYAGPATSGAIVSLFGTNLATNSAAASALPLPRSLGGTTVMFNSLPAPLFFVSPNQINLQIPSVFKAGSLANVTVNTSAGLSNSVQLRIASANPALFTADGSGCGQAAALNVGDGQSTVNSQFSSADPGDPVSLFGTGIDQVFFPPSDGEPSTGPTRFMGANSVEVDGYPAVYTYGGLAPSLVGVDQLNIKIPALAREGCSIPLVVSGSPVTTLSIHTGRGQCVDPPVQSYGRIYLTRTIASGTGNDAETDTFSATFPSAPGLRAPVAENGPQLGSYILGSSPGAPVPSRDCPVPGRVLLSAGQIHLQGPGAVMASVPPISKPGGVAYQQDLPAGFIVPGSYSISAAGSPVMLQAAFTIGSPVEPQSLQLGTISESQPYTVRWTGGDPSSIVKVALVSISGSVPSETFGYVRASAGSFTFQPFCSGAGSSGHGICSYQLPNGAAHLVIETLPDPATTVPAFLTPGITGTVQVRWDYKLELGGISLAP